MTTPVNFYADFKGLASLKNDATQQDPKALREAARQFESLFTQMMLKSMRDATKAFQSDNPLMGSDQTDFYREMFDNQLAVQMSKGRGLGLADVLVRQLQGGVAPLAKEVPASNKVGEGSAPTLTLPRGAGEGIRTPLKIDVDGKALISVPLPRSTEEGRVGASSSAIDAAPQTTAVIDSNDELAIFHGSVDETANANQPLPESRPVTVDSISRTARRDSIATTPDEFVTQLWPHAKVAADELGVDPHMLIAQAALETGWGKSIPCNPDGTCSFNLFGIKAGGRWQGPAVGVNTLEFEDGMAVRRRASFRAYESAADSFRDYASLIKNSPRYAAALGTGSDTAAFANALQQGGYATDPNYANKLTAVAERLRASLKTDTPQPLALGKRVSIGGQT